MEAVGKGPLYKVLVYYSCVYLCFAESKLASFLGFAHPTTDFSLLHLTKGLKLLEGISTLIMIRVYLCKQLQWELLFYSELCALVVKMQLFWGAILVNHITVWFLHICAVFKLKKGGGGALGSPPHPKRVGLVFFLTKVISFIWSRAKLHQQNWR